jgi:glyoxylase-like metal-dependent hydrolase (beta-lactamase superfamily II)
VDDVGISGHVAHSHSPGPKPRKQEQEPASDEVVEVAPGVLRAQLPISMPGLGHVNCYVLPDERGAAIVDPGLPGQATFKALTKRLASAGIPVSRVHTVVVTHSHPDHFGGAGWVRRESGADVVTHRRFHTYFDRDEPPDVDVESVAAGGASTNGDGDTGRHWTPWDAPPWGGPARPMPLRQRWRWRAMRAVPRLARTPQPTRRLDDADTIRLAGREWVAVWTPGHTDDHLCLFDPEDGVMLSGDHVLPTITPHISGLDGRRDALADFFESLDRVGSFGDRVTVSLPAHGQPFSDLAGRAAAIKDHHLERLDRVRKASEEKGRPLSVAEVSTFLFSPRAQGPMADSETYAHLEHLRLIGEYARSESADGYYRYAPT